MDSVEFVKGVSIKFLEMDAFFAENTQFVGAVVFIVLAITPEIRNLVYVASKKEIHATVDLINKKYSCELVYYEERPPNDIHLGERLAFFAAADILMVTSIP